MYLKQLLNEYFLEAEKLLRGKRNKLAEHNLEKEALNKMNLK